MMFKYESWHSIHQQYCVWPVFGGIEHTWGDRNEKILAPVLPRAAPAKAEVEEEKEKQHENHHAKQAEEQHEREPELRSVETKDLEPPIL